MAAGKAAAKASHFWWHFASVSMLVVGLMCPPLALRTTGSQPLAGPFAATHQPSAFRACVVVSCSLPLPACFQKNESPDHGAGYCEFSSPHLPGAVISSVLSALLHLILKVKSFRAYSGDKTKTQGLSLPGSPGTKQWNWGSS